MTEKQKPSQISNINIQIDKLKQQIHENSEQIKKFIEKRDQLHAKIRITHEEVNKLKVERDALNLRVKELKQQRNAVRVNVTPIMDEMKTLNDKIDALKKNLPRISRQELQQELDAIEWKISTTTMDLQEERHLIDNVKELETQLINYKKIAIQHKKIKELLEHRKTFDTQADVYHKELTDVAKKSQDLHAIMIEKVTAIRRDRAEANGLHQSFVRAKEQNTLMYEQIRQLINQATGIRATLRDQYHIRRKEDQTRRKNDEEKRRQEQTERSIKEQAIKEKIGTEAREKLNRGEKVNWEEFAMMLGDDEYNETEA
ncbi:MAG: hypothetical protein LBQ98_06190 [Nitrososphaerota archaeon]|nr:hypothetical protein [Nitrososphaerota archaeon]